MFTFTSLDKTAVELNSKFDFDGCIWIELESFIEEDSILLIKVLNWVPFTDVACVCDDIIVDILVVTFNNGFIEIKLFALTEDIITHGSLITVVTNLQNEFKNTWLDEACRIILVGDVEETTKFDVWEVSNNFVLSFISITEVNNVSLELLLTKIIDEIFCILDCNVDEVIGLVTFILLVFNICEDISINSLEWNIFVLLNNVVSVLEFVSDVNLLVAMLLEDGTKEILSFINDDTLLVKPVDKDLANIKLCEDCSGKTAIEPEE